MNIIRHARRYVVGAIALAASGLGQAEEVNLAVAANFTAAMKEIVTAFEAQSVHRAIVSYGSTGKLYAQIANGAPFAIFLAADSARPELAEEEGLAVPGSRFTYAVGKLVLWSPDPQTVDPAGEVLKDPDLERLAIANPKTAPYGAAARQVLEGMGRWESLIPRIVKGDSITQTYQFVASGNVPMGFVALAQVALLPEDEAGSRWMIPEELYTPLSQQAVLLKNGADNAAARALFTFLQSAEAKAIITRYGYGME